MYISAGCSAGANETLLRLNDTTNTTRLCVAVTKMNYPARHKKRTTENTTRHAVCERIGLDAAQKHNKHNRQNNNEQHF